MKERPLRIFIDPEKISNYLHCPICHEVFDQPNRLGCGHTFCYLCIQQWASLSKACPLCKKSLKHRRPEKDLIAASLIDEMQAKCSHEKCQWTGVYSSLKKHQRTCNYREKKKFESGNFDEIVELNDDQEMIMKAMGEEERNGRKLVKRNQRVMPIFPSDEDQGVGVVSNYSDHIRRNVRQTIENQRQKQDIQTQNHSHSLSSSNTNSQSFNSNLSSSSISNSSSLSFNLTQLVQNRPHSNLPLLHQLSEQYPENMLQTLPIVKNNRFSCNNLLSEQNEGEYFYQPLKKERQRRRYETKELIDLGESQQKPDADSNYFIIQKNKKEEEKKQKAQQIKQTNNKWGLANYAQKREKNYDEQKMQRQYYEDIDSSFSSNPFDEPIVKIKKSTKKQFIVIDSSEQSKCERSMQSGEMCINSQKRNQKEKLQRKNGDKEERASYKVYTKKQSNMQSIPEKQYRESTIECYQSDQSKIQESQEYKGYY